MSFNINNTNFQCAPMYNRNKNNQVMGYLCSSGSRNVEGFADDVTKWSGFHAPTYNNKNDGNRMDNNTYWYLLDIEPRAAFKGGPMQKIEFTLSSSSGGGSKIKEILANLVNNERMFDNRNGNIRKGSGNTCVSVLCLWNGNPYYIVNPGLIVEGDLLTITGDSNGDTTWGMENFSKLENLGASGWQVRIGAIDVDNKSMRQLKN